MEILKKRQEQYNELLNKTFNPKIEIEYKNKIKIELRKKDNLNSLMKYRKININVNKVNSKTKINQEYQFKIINLEDSYKQVFLYLNSKNKDFISYSLNQLRIYFSYNNINKKEQKLILDNNLFDILLNLGDECVNNKEIDILNQILWILINIQISDKRDNYIFTILYTEEYFAFYNICITKINDGEIYTKILMILINLIGNNSINNIDILKSDVFASILNYYKTQSIIEINDKKLLLKIICFALNLVNYNHLLNEKEINIIKKCYNLLFFETLGEKKVELLYEVYEGIFNITNIDKIYKFNEIIINDRLPIKFMKIQLDDSILIEKILRIINNNLNASADFYNIIDNNILIGYYNNVLLKFSNNYEIIQHVLSGLSKIAEGGYKNAIKFSIIWEEKNYRKYCDLNDEIKLYYLKIIYDLSFINNDDIFECIINSNILNYFISIFKLGQPNKEISDKIIKILIIYIDKFKQLNYKQEYKFLCENIEELFKLSNLNSLDYFQFISIIKND